MKRRNALVGVKPDAPLLISMWLRGEEERHSVVGVVNQLVSEGHIPPQTFVVLSWKPEAVGELLLEVPVTSYPQGIANLLFQEMAARLSIRIRAKAMSPKSYLKHAWIVVRAKEGKG